jgi:hypothetical protein
MHEDELRRQIAELVADHADHATAPPVTAIRRRGRIRRIRQASTVVLLIAALAAGVVAVQQPLGRQIHPVPVVTQPPGLVVNQAPIPLHPNPGFAHYVQAQFNTKLLDITVVAWSGVTAGGADWQLAAVRGLKASEAAHKECLVHKTNGPSPGFKYNCRNQSASTAMTVDRSSNEHLLWGLLPEGATRVRLLERGAPPVEITALKIGPVFRRRCYIAVWTPGIQTVVALDGQGHQVAQSRIP